MKITMPHFRARVFERFGVRVSTEQINAYVDQIERGDATFIERRDDQITRWQITLPDGTDATVVYDSKRKKLVTALYPRSKT